ncbi:MAG TPA: glycosyltransferase family 39 protein, partial [Isosphaeraceae bacterium]|nr:glycosyltransferase family 39 protein [Isosphaeraceae bacterium]
RLATTDATLTLFVVACQFALWELAQRPSARAAAAFWVLLGLAILTKAPAGPALIVAAGAASWWFGGPIVCWARLRWRWGPALCALLVVPWNVAILLRSHGAYYDVAVGYHIVRRMTYGIEEHGGFPGYYVVTSLIAFFPWSALLPAALAGAWARRRVSPNFGFLLGWVIGPLVLLECVRTKLIHYYLPSFPACALLAAWLVVMLAESRADLCRWRLGRLSFSMLGSIGAGATLCFLAAGALAPASLRLPCVAMGVLTGSGVANAAWRLRRGEADRAVAGLAASMTLFAILAYAWLLPAAEPYRLAARAGSRLATIEKRERAAPVLCGFKPPSLVYALGHPAPVTGSKDLLINEAMRNGTIIAALRPDELSMLRRDPRFVLDLRESLQGLDNEKAKLATLHLALIRAAAPALAAHCGKTETR